jgi:carbonic anhydrase
VPDLAQAEQEKRTTIIGCVYDIQSGKVRTLIV